ncbi:DMT family transporter [Rhodococcus sp. NBC_00294]|uniref:DMT family transporter n=1 Tax=Rhodococcus sp. NBC_00294 TaxID=2976004 RepID=UPI002E2B50A4|nr:DMT family transporter [Rhodococcus sp. NBC_00294]
MTAIVLALIAALGYGVSDFVGGVASRRVAALRVVIVSYPVSVLVVAAVMPFVGGTLTASSVVWGALSGLAGGVAVWWFYLALAAGPMAVVSPITAVLVAGVPVGVGLVLGERPGVLAYIGIALALVAVLMVSKESPDDAAGDVAGGRTLRFTPRVAWLTVGSGLAFALTFIFLDRAGEDDAGLWPLLANRVTATALVWAVALGTGMFSFPRGGVLKLAAWIALLDVAANAALLYAFQGGLLSLVSVIASLYPAATVLLAMVMLGERVATVQIVGMVIALGAVGLITAGA